MPRGAVPARARFRFALIGIALVSLLIAVACGGDDEPSSSPTPALTITPSSTPTASPTPAVCRFEDSAELVVSGSALVITPTGFGTAFHIGDGQFVTAEHVVRGETSVRLESDRFTADAEVMAVESVADVALLKTDPSAVAEIPALSWFDGERLRVGQSAGAAGYPVDVTGSASVSRGTLSKLVTSERGLTVVQTDAPINPGNSGGALFNDCGEVIGVVVAKWNEAGVEGVAYATSFDAAQTAIANGEPPRDSGDLLTTFGDGTYEVGIDIAPGTYRNDDSSEFCYWERLSGFTPDEENGFGYTAEDRIANFSSYDIQTVVIEPSDAGFYALDCGRWTLLDESELEPEGERRSVFDLTLGDCFTPPPDDGSNVLTDDIWVISCEEPHQNEIYHAFDIAGPGDPYPGDAEVRSIWEETCLQEFTVFTGSEYETSRLGVGALYPTPESWETGDREVLCYVFDFFGDPLTGSMEGSGE